MKLIGEKTSTQPGEFKTITIRWPADTEVPTVHGKWQRLANGRIQAVYAPDELAICLKIAEIILEQEPVE